LPKPAQQEDCKSDQKNLATRQFRRLLARSAGN